MSLSKSESKSESKSGSKSGSNSADSARLHLVEQEQRALQLAALSPPGKPSKNQFRNSIRGDIITAVSFPDRLQQDRR